MGFTTFNEKYYRQVLEKYEHKPLRSEDIYRIKQLLKILDDLADEGYTDLNDTMERDFSCLSRLNHLLEKANAEPFKLDWELISVEEYCSDETELEMQIDFLVSRSKECELPCNNPFVSQIRSYSEWISFNPNTAYIFLLRDTLLPYLFFKSKGRTHIYPWLISRRFLEDVSGVKNIDDDFRLPIYEALETGCTNYDSFSNYCIERLQHIFDDHLPVKDILLKLLGSITEDKIVVVESGYAGTIPIFCT